MASNLPLFLRGNNKEMNILKTQFKYRPIKIMTQINTQINLKQICSSWSSTIFLTDVFTKSYDVPIQGSRTTTAGSFLAMIALF